MLRKYVILNLSGAVLTIILRSFIFREDKLLLDYLSTFQSLFFDRSTVSNRGNPIKLYNI